jgi:hypothetical protein
MTEPHELPEKIISRLKGAYRLANEAKNPNEAAVAAKMVQEIIQKYNISVEIFTTFDNEEKVIEKLLPGNGKNQDKVLASLANVIGKFNFVKVIMKSTRIRVNNTLTRIPAIAFIGRPTNVESVYNLTMNLNWRLRSLADEAFTRYKNECKRLGITGEHGKTWNYSWLMGAITGIYTQLEEQQEQFKKTQYTNQDGQVKTGMELVIKRGAELDAYVEENYSNLKTNKVSIKDNSAYTDGYNTGKNLNINQKELR